jgi:hypothetical protein
VIGIVLTYVKTRLGDSKDVNVEFIGDLFGVVAGVFLAAAGLGIISDSCSGARLFARAIRSSTACRIWQ